MTARFHCGRLDYLLAVSVNGAYWLAGAAEWVTDTRPPGRRSWNPVSAEYGAEYGMARAGSAHVKMGRCLLARAPASRSGSSFFPPWPPR
ncbi:MAG: hypothetical protein Q8P61_00615 [Candidatus Nanopelagicales bacterium]|nr:hypothetical protein [Candidatus Nanopelagicales bacterium]